MLREPLKMQLITGFCLFVILIASYSFIMTWDSQPDPPDPRDLLRRKNQVIHTDSINRHINLAQDLKEYYSESASTEALEAFKYSLADAREYISRVAPYLHTNETQLERLILLDSLIGIQQGMVDQLIELEETKGSNAVMRVIHSGQGQVLSALIQQQLHLLQEEEMKLAPATAAAGEVS